MEQSSEPGPSPIHVVEIPFQIKEEKMFQNEVNSPPDLHDEPGKLHNQCWFSCNFNLMKRKREAKREGKEKKD